DAQPGTSSRAQAGVLDRRWWRYARGDRKVRGGRRYFLYLDRWWRFLGVPGRQEATGRCGARGTSEVAANFTASCERGGDSRATTHDECSQVSTIRLHCPALSARSNTHSLPFVRAGGPSTLTAGRLLCFAEQKF